jgi:hypothetical protein
MLNDTWFGSKVFYIHVRECRHLNVILLPTHVKENLLEKLYHVGLWRVIIRGGYASLFSHNIILSGISLSASHLSDLTLTTGANIFRSLTDNVYKICYIIFTNKHLNID